MGGQPLLLQPNNRNIMLIENIRCPHCLSKPLDAWYIYDKFGKKHFWLRCGCAKKVFAVNLRLSRDLPFEVRKTKKQVKKEREEAQQTLL